ncbi:polycomb group protein Psc-like [Diorhabda carinulata]|uniref:polycomb group protein Psc-like n=1 Tax=Diorhabda carinulata TaxID=1163345 RepID=UPI0025A1CF85|nr:polycomb group protein Psc-like [Diorhabda carinulata]
MEQQQIKQRPEKIKLTEINPYLTCYLCKGYLIDATTISECLHSFCRSCIIKFLQDNSYCPICEVIINKAKPNLKLDKTLQDIVYKLVPELFLKEMTRRKQYYQQYPQIAARVSPEERGEDTERTIFNPQDCISLSMEYVSSDSSPGAIKLPGIKNDVDKNDEISIEDNQTHMKRYLQCPGMCRVDVLKKFVRNKYNVDTSLFYIDILYKRVPLPDHYTLIDIAYIYSWKRNEPMKFFFRITDLNKVSERFDYFDSKNTNETLVQLPLRSSRNNGAASRRKEHVLNKKNSKAIKQQDNKVQSNGCDKINTKIKAETSDCEINSDKIGEQQLNSNKENVKVKEETKINSDNYQENTEESTKRFVLKIKKDPEKDNAIKEDISVINTNEIKNSVVKPEVSGHLKNNVQNQKNSVYTNITLNRSNNMEIITKIQKLSNKDGQSLGFNIIKQTVKSNDNNKKLETENDSTENEEKIKFLKTFELTAKTSPKLKNKEETTKRKISSPPKRESPLKKSKTEKKPVTRIILQNKPKLSTPGLQSLIENCKIPSSLSITIKNGTETNKPTPMIPPVKNYIEILKLPDETKPIKEDTNFRINADSEQKVDEDLAEIAKSLTEKIPISTTVSQIIGPKQEFSIPTKPTKFNIQPSPVPELTNKLLNVPKENKLNPRSPQSFQKIFEESIKKPDISSPEKESNNEVTSTSNNNNNNKRNLMEITTKLYKKTKMEMEKNQIDSTTTTTTTMTTTTTTTPKIPIPRLSNSKNSISDAVDKRKCQTTLNNLHSNALGLNYTISVGPSKGGAVTKKDEASSSSSSSSSPKSSPMIKHMYAPMMEQLKVNTYSPKSNKPPSGHLATSSVSPPKPSSSSSSTSQTTPLNPNQILERYSIQNLAQLTANLNYGLNHPGNQLAAIQHAMFLKHFEIQNRQNWLNMNQGSLMQYEKYLQNLQKTSQNHLLTKEN